MSSPPPEAPSSRTASLLLAAGAAFCLTPWGSPPLALALGAALALTIGNPRPGPSRIAAKYLLQVSVVLLGFSMDLRKVLEAGASGMVFAAATITATLALGWATGRWLSVERTTSVLIASGTAICGGSAIAAVGTVIGAADAQMSVAIGTVFLLNAAALYLFPMLGHLLHLSQSQFGTWAGVSIHDISSVVGATSVYGLEALQRGTAVKLSRALWIVPLSLGAALAMRRVRAGSAGPARARVAVPWFIGFFLLASVVRSASSDVAAASPAIARVARAGMTLTLFLIGAGLSRKALAAVGWRPLAQGILLWLAIGGLSLLVVLHSA